MAKIRPTPANASDSDSDSDTVNSLEDSQFIKKKKKLRKQHYDDLQI